MSPWGDSKMIVTTTPSIEGRSIREYRGVVVGEAILGANIFRDVFAQIKQCFVHRVLPRHQRSIVPVRRIFFCN